MLTKGPDNADMSRRICKLRERGIPHVVLHGRLFCRSHGVVRVNGPDCLDVALTDEDCRYLLKNLGGSIVIWTKGFQHGNDQGVWYSVICRRFTPLGALSSKRRSELKRGLRNCDVRRISPAELAEAGYPVLRAAYSSYDGYHVRAPAEDRFKTNVLREVAYQDLVHNWGVYSNGVLVAFAQNQIHGTTEACYSDIKLDPKHLSLYPAYALIYRMNEHYLCEAGFEYVNDGSRSIYHKTNIQEFLIQKFGFEKAYTDLHVYYRWPLRWFVNVTYPFRRYVAHVSRRGNALLELERCARLTASPITAAGADS